MVDVRSGYRDIVAHYEECLARYGDTCRGVDWPNAEDALKRYQVMLGLIEPLQGDERVSLLDFGCGASHLYENIRDRSIAGIDYAGLDLSEAFIGLSKAKFPKNDYYCTDLLDPDAALLPVFDYIIMNGVFTEKRGMSFDAMLSYWKALTKRVFNHTGRGMAFNVMSKQVDWERDDLFHLPLDTLADFLTKEITRNFVIRNDYGLFEYTVYVYKEGAKWQRS